MSGTHASTRHYATDYWFADTVSCAAHPAQRTQIKKLLEKLRKGEMLVVAKLGHDAPIVLSTLSRRWQYSESRQSYCSSASST